MRLTTKTFGSLSLVLSMTLLSLLGFTSACGEKHSDLMWQEEEEEEEMETELMDWDSRVYWMANVSEARVGVMAAPIGPKLDLEVNAWKEEQVAVVVSMLQANEINTLGLEAEGATCEEVGIQFIHFPVQDFSIPSSPEEVNTLCQNIIDGLDEDKGVVFHCRGGIGRAPTVSACLLVKLGYTTDQAFEIISTARGINTPETAQQLQFVHDFQAEFGG